MDSCFYHHPYQLEFKDIITLTEFRLAKIYLVILQTKQNTVVQEIIPSPIRLYVVVKVSGYKVGDCES